MKYLVQKANLHRVRQYLIDIDIEFHKEFEMYFRSIDIYSGVYVIDFFSEADRTAFELKFPSTFYEKSNN